MRDGKAVRTQFPRITLALGVAGLPLLSGGQADAAVYGAWASATAQTLTNTSGPAEPPVNGFLSQSATASISTDAGSSSATGDAVVGALSGVANVSGCLTGLFQQPCISSSTYTEFYDQWQLTGAPAGTPVSVEWTLTTSGTLSGQSAWGYGSTLSDGFYEVENSDGSGGLVVAQTGTLSKTVSWTATYNVGTAYTLVGSMNLGVTERNCWDGSFDCGVVISGSLELGNAISATILTPGVDLQMVSASGNDYLASPVPLPAAGWLLGSGLIAWLAPARRRTRRAQAASAR